MMITLDFLLSSESTEGGAENAGVENAGVYSMGGKCRNGKCRSDDGWRAISIENYKIPVV